MKGNKMRQLSKRIITVGIALFVVCIEIFSQAEYFVIYADGNVRMLIIDGAGRKLGYDPNTKTYFEQIPRSSIGAAGIDIVTDEGGESDESQSNPVEAMIFDVVEGRYQIIVSGKSLSFFSLQFRTEYNNKGKTFETGGIIDSAQTVSFNFTFTTTSGLVFEVERVISSSTLRQDLAASFKLNLLGDKEFYKDLSKRLEKFERELADKDSSKARHELEKFGKKLEEVRKETIKNEEKKEKEEKKFITADAYQILQEDVNTLLKQLPAKKKGEKDEEDD